jgi:restriction system protein
VLSDLLGIQRDRFFPIVIFWGNCRLMTPMPPNVLTSGFPGYIRSKTLVLFDDADVKRIVAAIRNVMLPRTWGTRRRHVARLKERFGSTVTCPSCGSPLTLRTARNGSHAGSQFYGCTRYPICRYVKS